MSDDHEVGHGARVEVEVEVENGAHADDQVDSCSVVHHILDALAMVEAPARSLYYRLAIGASSPATPAVQNIPQNAPMETSRAQRDAPGKIPS